MTLKELNKLRYIENEIIDYAEKIREMRDIAEGITASYNGMPSGSSRGGKVERAVVSIVHYTEKLENLRLRKVEETERIHGYIIGIDDDEVRYIMFLRFVQLKSWNAIARRIGGNNTASAVRMRVIRFIEKENAQK